MNQHEHLIDSLSRDLEPVAPAANVNRQGLTWLVVSAIFVVAITHLVDPVRAGAY